MCLNASIFGRMRGSVLLIALFVIVVMGGLAATMSRFLLDSEEKNTVEISSIRAFLAAQSGLEIALFQLFHHKPISPNIPFDRCTLINNNPQFERNSGLSSCKVSVSCKKQTSVDYHYQLESNGTCGSTISQALRVSRTVIVHAFDKE